jgi:hypothetical protein
MNSTLMRAGRTTHLKIVAIALCAVISVVAVGFGARSGSFANSPHGVAVKTGQPAAYAGQESITVR